MELTIPNVVDIIIIWNFEKKRKMEAKITHAREIVVVKNTLMLTFTQEEERLLDTLSIYSLYPNLKQKSSEFLSGFPSFTRIF